MSASCGTLTVVSEDGDGGDGENGDNGGNGGAQPPDGDGGGLTREQLIIGGGALAGVGALGFLALRDRNGR